MTFIDLFAGLGGFHVALRRLGHECVFASEIDPTLRALYAKNFGLSSHGDIRQVNISRIPPHIFFCAGFPCQPFSKAGRQKGLECPQNGSLFDNVIGILEARKPEFIILENVPNLSRHAGGKTWAEMRTRLEEAGYKIDEDRLSPHQFGIPQIRERVYIVGCRAGLTHFRWPQPKGKVSTTILSALEKEPEDARPVPQQVIDCLNVWQRFVERYPKDEYLPTHPIWSMEFGATYPYETETPHAAGLRRLCWYKGCHGLDLGNLPRASECRACHRTLG